MFRNNVSLFLFLLFLASCGPQQQQTAKDQRPNILFIISDDLSAEALGAYGNQQCLTPNIDRLASRGIRFTRAYCQYPVCGPSRAALMAGRYPQQLGIMGNGQSNRIDEALGTHPSMAEHFKLNGYRSTRLSKIFHMRVPGDITAGVDGPDHAESWSEKHNFQGPEWMTEGEHKHLSQEKLQFKSDVHYNLGFGSAFYVVKGEGDGSEQPDYRATSKAVEILQKHRDGVDSPFFLAVGYVRPHVPLVAPASEYAPYPPDRIDLPQKVANDQTDIPDLGIPRTSTHFGIENTDSQQEVLSAYYASVSFMDRQVGRLLDALDEQDLNDNTIVVFTSDHGYHLGEHDFWQKMSLHEESTRIPLIIAGPDIDFSQTDALAEQIDIYPTLSALAGLSIPEQVQGKSLLPVIKDQRAAVREAAYCVTQKGAMLRTDDWAYLEYEDGSTELYDMKKDRAQFNNLAEVPYYEAKRVEMARRMQQKKAIIQSKP